MFSVYIRLIVSIIHRCNKYDARFRTSVMFMDVGIITLAVSSIILSAVKYFHFLNELLDCEVREMTSKNL